MRTKDRIFGGISIAAALFGVVAILTGHLPLGAPALIIGLMILWTVADNRNWK